MISTSRNVQFEPNNDNYNRGVMHKGSYVKGINNSRNNNNLKTKRVKSKNKEDFFDRRNERHGPDDHKDFPLLSKSRDNPTGHQYQQNKVDRPLSEFPTLQYPLGNSELIGLFFGSSDCATCNKMIHKLSNYFGVDGILLRPSTLSQPNGNNNNNNGNRRPMQNQDDDNVEKTWPLSLVYVSSDRDKSSFNSFATERSGSGSGLGSEWFKVPWNGPERSGLKRHFRIGAAHELKDLDLSTDTRRFDIPALIIIDNKSRSILSANGMEDVVEFGDKALDRKYGPVYIPQKQETRECIDDWRVVSLFHIRYLLLVGEISLTDRSDILLSFFSSSFSFFDFQTGWTCMTLCEQWRKNMLLPPPPNRNNDRRKYIE